jgi:hypothetical protein
MASIRSIKPDYCTSEAIAEMSRDLRLHFALLWTYADDDGRGKDNAKLIKAELWPLDDDVTAAQVERWQQGLADHGRIVRYEVDGRRFFEVVNFTEHQKPNRPVESKLPPCSEGRPWSPPAPSTDTHEQSSESAVSTHEHLTPVVVDGGGDVDGGENTPSTSTAVALVNEPGPPAEPAKSDYPEAFERWWKIYPRHVGKGEAFTAWKRAKAKVGAERLLEAIEVSAAAWRRHGYETQFIPHASKWLNGGRYDDPPPEPRSQPNSRTATNRARLSASLDRMRGATA